MKVRLSSTSSFTLICCFCEKKSGQVSLSKGDFLYAVVVRSLHPLIMDMKSSLFWAFNN